MPYGVRTELWLANSAPSAEGVLAGIYHAALHFLVLMIRSQEETVDK
jgi:hypothetical protein